MAIIQALALLAFVHYSEAAEICCGNLGCFDDLDPFVGFPLPECPEIFGLVYTMYTQANRDNGEVFDATSVPSVYNGARRTVFMAHGWNSDGTSEWLHRMKNTFLDNEDVNAVILDWGGGAQLLYYPQAASNTRTVGAYTATVFANLASQAGSASSRMWCIGHSLGAHVCGHTGMRTSLGRVTGLDPAGPWFEDEPDLTVGLNPTSAAFVDVIHTAAEDLGTVRVLGHMDFYPAGGWHMPGCFLKDREESSLQAIVAWDSKGMARRDSCSHSLAYEFMIESIKADCFLANQQCTDWSNIPGSCTACDSSACGTGPCAFLGYAADISCQPSGIWYLDVTGTPPYCVN